MARDLSWAREVAADLHAWAADDLSSMVVRVSDPGDTTTGAAFVIKELDRSGNPVRSVAVFVVDQSAVFVVDQSAPDSELSATELPGQL